MENLRKICGKFLGMYGKPMDNLWKNDRYVWNTYRKPMEETGLKKIIF